MIIIPAVSERFGVAAKVSDPTRACRKRRRWNQSRRRFSSPRESYSDSKRSNSAASALASRKRLLRIRRIPSGVNLENRSHAQGVVAIKPPKYPNFGELRHSHQSRLILLVQNDFSFGFCFSYPANWTKREIYHRQRDLTDLIPDCSLRTAVSAEPLQIRRQSPGSTPQAAAD
jgi:hypothetical protein